MSRVPISRRSLLWAAAGSIACGRKKAPRASGYCFVANQESRTVSVVSLERFRLEHHISLDAAPSAVLAHPERGKVYVLAPDNGTVYEIEAGTFSVSRRARAGSQAVQMQMAPAMDALWVLYREPAALVELPLDSFKPARRVRLASPPDCFDIVRQKSSHQPIAGIASRQDHSIAFASLVKASVERTATCGDEPSIVQFQDDGAQLIAGSWRGHSATIFDVPAARTVVRLPLPLGPRHFCATTDGGQIFITGDGMDAVAVLFPYQTEIFQTILAGRAPGYMAVNNTDNNPAYLMVSNPQADAVTVLDVATYKLVTVVQVGQSPGQILLTPDWEYALVLNEKSGDMAVIRILSLATTPTGDARQYRSAPAPIFTLIPVGEKPVSAAILA